MASLSRCIGSVDALHIYMLKCNYKLKKYHESFKLLMPSRTYNTAVSHHICILSTTKGHPGHWNDKTLILYDNLATSFHHGEIYVDLEFILYEHDASGCIKEVHYVGACTISDDGYLSWSTTVPPLKFYSTYEEMRFMQIWNSERLV